MGPALRRPSSAFPRLRDWHRRFPNQSGRKILISFLRRLESNLQTQKAVSRQNMQQSLPNSILLVDDGCWIIGNSRANQFRGVAVNRKIERLTGRRLSAQIEEVLA